MLAQSCMKANHSLNHTNNKHKDLPIVFVVSNRLSWVMSDHIDYIEII